MRIVIATFVLLSLGCAPAPAGPTTDYDDVYGYRLHAAEAELARLRVVKCTR